MKNLPKPPMPPGTLKSINDWLVFYRDEIKDAVRKLGALGRARASAKIGAAPALKVQKKPRTDSVVFNSANTLAGGRKKRARR